MMTMLSDNQSAVKGEGLEGFRK